MTAWKQCLHEAVKYVQWLEAGIVQWSKAIVSDASVFAFYPKVYYPNNNRNCPDDAKNRPAYAAAGYYCMMTIVRSVVVVSRVVIATW